MICILNAERNVLFNSLRSCLPKENVRNLDVELLNAVLINEINTTTPLTTLYKPKSTSPRICKITREVYIPTPIVINILRYKYIEFFMIKLLLLLIGI